MSRYNFLHYTPHGEVEVFVGWDNPLKTFFFQIWDDEEDEPVHSAGMIPNEIPSVEHLKTWLADNGISLDQSLVPKLQNDWEKQKPLSPLQAQMLSIFNL